MLSQRLGVVNRIASSDLSWKVELLLLPSTLNPDWRIFSVERRYIYILGTQYTSYIFDIATLVVPFAGSKISCLIRTVSEVTINSGALSLQSQLDYNYPKSY